MYLECVLPQLDSGSGQQWWVNSVGNVMIKKAEIEIGGQLIDRHYGEWMDIWSELTVPVGKKTVGYDIMVGNHETSASVEKMVSTLDVFTFHFNSGSTETQVLLYHLLPFNTTKSNSILNLDQ